MRTLHNKAKQSPVKSFPELSLRSGNEAILDIGASYRPLGIASLAFGKLAKDNISIGSNYAPDGAPRNKIKLCKGENKARPY